MEGWPAADVRARRSQARHTALRRFGGAARSCECCRARCAGCGDLPCGGLLQAGVVGGDVDEEVAPGMGGVVGGMDVEHGSILFRRLWNVRSLRRLALVGGCYCHSTRSRDFGRWKLFWGFWCLWHAVSCGVRSARLSAIRGRPRNLAANFPENGAFSETTRPFSPLL